MIVLTGGVERRKYRPTLYKLYIVNKFLLVGTAGVVTDGTREERQCSDC